MYVWMDFSFKWRTINIKLRREIRFQGTETRMKEKREKENFLVKSEAIQAGN